MKFKLLEGKQELLAKYGDRFKDRKSFDIIYNSIPANLKGYGDWVFKNVLERGESSSSLIDALNAFVKYKDRLEVKDINKYSSKEDVEDAIFYAQEKGSKKEKLYNAELVYEDNKVKVVRPLTHEASRHYGTGTKWCTATASTKHFNNYITKGKLFYILPKSGETKYAIFSYFTFNPEDKQRMEGFNKKDDPIEPKKIIEKFGLSPKLFSAFLPINFKSEEGIKQWLYLLGIKKHKISQDLVVDVTGDVVLEGMNLTSIPIVFGKISGGFFCYDNNLTSLQGAPREVGGDFSCYENNLTSLQGAPQKVGGGFYVHYNNLTSLQGAPQKVGEDFYCSNNNLTSLQGAPQKVGWDFHCQDNYLTSLQGAPQEVKGTFYCGRNPRLPKSEIARIRKMYQNVDVRENIEKIKFRIVGE
jgi:hypothetical protein